MPNTLLVPTAENAAAQRRTLGHQQRLFDQSKADQQMAINPPICYESEQFPLAPRSKIHEVLGYV
jgi:hypothetical protein